MGKISGSGRGSSYKDEVQSILGFREIRFRGHIFGAPAVPMGDIMLIPFEIRDFDIREFSI